MLFYHFMCLNVSLTIFYLSPAFASIQYNLVEFRHYFSIWSSVLFSKDNTTFLSIIKKKQNFLHVAINGELLNCEAVSCDNYWRVAAVRDYSTCNQVTTVRQKHGSKNICFIITHDLLKDYASMSFRLRVSKQLFVLLVIYI